MAIERTLSIIKPDGVSRNLIGKIISLFEENGLSLVASRMQIMSRHEAEGFYAVHKARPFFGELVSYMCSGPVLLMVLEGENAILKNREIMGATNPADAQPGTIRKLYAKSIGENTVHGSDAPETASFEVSWFFKGSEVCSRH
ncbi:MAG: nucleoside-diphosphate kinase [Myxococcales bacterium]|nr:nucleoside-diphosphate kinase [Myxococcales bacterium]USN50542.1 MAG: nucleoside-diphosphate kinase [Myxococcales bacterium]